MKRTALLILLLLLFSFLIAFHVNSTTANVKTPTSFSADLEIEKVDHVVQLKDGGSVVISDTVKLSSPEESTSLLQNFSIGFPYQFQSNLDYCFAYDPSHPKLDVELDVGLDQRLGFYGINVNFPEPVEISASRSYNFTVVSAFSNLISPNTELSIKEPTEPEEVPSLENKTYFYFDFPVYPGLTQKASICNVTVILPEHMFILNSSRSEWPLGATGILNFTERNLKAFTYEEPIVLRTSVRLHEPPVTYEEKAWLKLGLHVNAPPDAFTVIAVNEIKRDIRLDEWGQIFLSDSYHITDKASNLSSVEIRLPDGAYDLSYPEEQRAQWIHSEDLPVVAIGFGRGLEKGESVEITVNYRLPWTEHVTQTTWRDFNLAFSFFEPVYFNRTIRKLSIAIDLPKNADFRSCSVQPQSVEESLTFSFSNVAPFHDLDFLLAYEYVIFWASFYPTLWVGLVATAVCVIAFLWRAPKPPPVPAIPVSSEALRSFVDTYERKTTAIRELEMLEQQVRKRKIPRRRYKVRKKALDGRLSVLSKDLTDLKEEIRKAGSRYANTMRQIEVAETELEETEAAIRRIELRYRRREISKGTHRKLMEEYNRRKERAETTIDGVLLRLREEIR